MLRLYSWAAYVGHAALFTGSVWVVIFLALGNPGNQTGNQAGCDTPTSASTSLSKESEFCDLVFSLEKEVSSRENCHKHSFYHLWVSSRHEMLKIALILKCIKATATLMEGAPLNIYGKLVTKNPYCMIKKHICGFYILSPLLQRHQQTSSGRTRRSTDKEAEHVLLSWLFLTEQQSVESH